MNWGCSVQVVFVLVVLQFVFCYVEILENTRNATPACMSAQNRLGSETSSLLGEYRTRRYQSVIPVGYSLHCFQLQILKRQQVLLMMPLLGLARCQ